MADTDDKPTAISTFKHHFTSVRPTLFKITPVYSGFTAMTPSPDLHFNVADVKHANAFYFYAKASTLPASIVGEIEVPFMGRKFYEHGDREFNPWDITIVNSQDFSIRNWLETWMNGMNQHDANKEGGNRFNGAGFFRGINTLEGSGSDYYNYFCDFLIEQLNRRNDVIAKYRMIDAFPTQCGEISMDYSSTNQIEEFTATFRHQYWIREEGVVGEPQITDVYGENVNQ